MRFVPTQQLLLVVLGDVETFCFGGLLRERLQCKAWEQRANP